MELDEQLVPSLDQPRVQILQALGRSAQTFHRRVALRRLAVQWRALELLPQPLEEELLGQSFSKEGQLPLDVLAHRGRDLRRFDDPEKQPARVRIHLDVGQDREEASLLHEGAAGCRLGEQLVRLDPRFLGHQRSSELAGLPLDLTLDGVEDLAPRDFVQ
ncbi:MAG: hypothetical protein R3F43_03810 [bacterium]